MGDFFRPAKKSAKSTKNEGVGRRFFYNWDF
jgi:hypothetical protein